MSQSFQTIAVDTAGAIIAVVIPCYRVTAHVLQVIDKVPPLVWRIYCVDDGCPDRSGDFIGANCTDARVSVLRHQKNEGVGGAMVTGYRAALAAGAEIIVKIDGDGQMDPALIPRMVLPIIDRNADYTKGNRFFQPKSLIGMPAYRLFGNAILSVLCKVSSGYWTIFDPANGYTAIHSIALRLISLDKVSRGYFFECDMLFRLNIIRAVVIDVPINAVYGAEQSNLRIRSNVLPLIFGHFRNFLKRFMYDYMIRDFSLASLEAIVGAISLILGVVFGVASWLASVAAGQPASAGTVMLSALPVLIGFQMLLSALNFDVMNAPRYPLCRLMGEKAGPQAVPAEQSESYVSPLQPVAGGPSVDRVRADQARSPVDR